jgi:glutamine cyclotransferase
MNRLLRSALGSGLVLGMALISSGCMATPGVSESSAATATAQPSSTTTPSITATRTATVAVSPAATGAGGGDPSPDAVTPIAGPTTDVAQETVTPIYTYRVVNVYPHDPKGFTQGLAFDEGVLYEGTGLLARSSLRRVELETGQVLQLQALPAHLFGEGVTVFGDRIIQLTWKSHVGLVYDKETFERQRDFAYPTEGWGLTHDGMRLIISDGSSTLHFLDPETLEEIGQIDVHYDGVPVTRLNELEYVQGEVFANVWKTDLVARIDPETGQVVGWIELVGLLSPEDHDGPIGVLNGIAYDPEDDRLFVTGKLWSKLFEIKLVPLR